MKTIRVGGVPEHFNMPWHLCIEDGDFEYEQLKIEWRDFPDGTGAMNKALRNNEIDVAIILTEGVIKDITAGNPVKVIQKYIASPLIWGIHVAAASPFKEVKELEHTKAAISREGSGSQLMAYVNAKDQKWDLAALDFEIVGDIDGAVKALEQDRAQYFMWERFTTKPLVDKSVFRRVGDCPTPWPCFVVAAREDFIHTHEHDLAKMLDVVNSKSVSFKEVPGVEKLVAQRYDQKEEDIKEWLGITSWSQVQISEEEVQKVQETLKLLGLIEKGMKASDFIYNLEADSL
ncbi:ABC transporter substrate-binding protein [Antarcticibacterium flavum]|uniref:ABC transporter substrate-binding protein n=1 Tax=Antarcticibacterium flavum TaxID=2058175 RepID=A0A5B7WYI0_9FLAO|nr:MULTISPECIES: substrate-binding domain-containing protein [Antarcticibacterium]MCM4158861.1 ABC transporter substrate-binding protein [Antarcticibacterium sp. W02-3]QCY68120.1 ABC transporter substrate-binding protein [Antarcticibacterium flavum]